MKSPFTPADPLGMVRLIWRTVAPLRWEQLVYRPWRVAQKRLYRHVPVLAERWRRVTEPGPPVDRAGLEAIQGLLREEGAAHLLPAPDATLIEEWEAFRAGRFTLLGRSRTLPAPDWNARYESHLWNYQLHYFGWTLDCVRQRVERGIQEPLERCQRLIEQWMDEACPGRSDGWDAYPLSLRVVHWIYGYCLLATIESTTDRPLPASFLERWRGSMHRQLAFLSGHLEYHLLANHLFKNAKALVIGGVFFGERRWLAKGLRLLWREVEEQVLPDGGHFERAPMYHAQTLGDLLECVALLRRIGEPIPSEVATRLSAMVDFLDAVQEQTGDRLAAFNDTAATRETRPGPLLETARRMGLPVPAPCPASQGRSRQFPETGYHIWIRSDASGQMTEKIIVDTGPPSVSYNTAHAHCDLLSFELHLDGHLWIADTGVHGYGGDPFRAYCRSTRAHNTLTIDGEEQSEIWGTFRMGRRAEPLDATSQGAADEWTCLAAYRPGLHPHLRHERRFRRAPDGSWTIEDRILPPSAKRRGSPPGWQVESFLHLTPEISVERDGAGPGVRLSRGTVHYRLLPFGESLPEMEIHRAVEGAAEGWLFPAFGVAVPGTMLTYHWTISENQPFGFRLLPQAP
ncbi:MAG: heparinase II/III family protein [Blastocatellia bacterium]